MSGTVREARLQTVTARARLKRGRQPHWRALNVSAGRAHLGYQRKSSNVSGRWLLRRYSDGRYSVEALGRADDGDGGLTFEQAEALAQARTGAAPTSRLTVRRAMAAYVEYLEAQGKPTAGVIGRVAIHVLPCLGDVEVDQLTAATIRRWLADLARAPAMLRSPAQGRANLRHHDPADDEAVRRRRNSANRVLSILKAGLNHAYNEGLVNSNAAWGRRVRPFAEANAARLRYLTVDEATRLLNACEPDLRLLVRGALETGARLSELLRLRTEDFNADAGTIHVRRSKSGRERHVVLTADGIAFFASLVLGRTGQMFVRADGHPWGRTAQQFPLRRACAAARLEPPITFHGLRHSWASLAVQGGVPLPVVAQNLGHINSAITEKHYAHLAPSYVADAIRAGAPRFGAVAAGGVLPLRPRRN
jgi:integrase